MNSPPFISVIIPTYNRSHLLSLTLDSFLAQKYPGDRFEIIVVDNNSTDATRGVAARYAEDTTVPVPVTYLLEQRQGVHYARNGAAKKARGEILYFTDDDMVADPSLLREMAKVFDLDPTIACATGKVLPRWEVPPPEWVRELCANSLLSLQEKVEVLIVSQSDVGVFSCHQAIRRDVFFHSGGFNPENTAGEWIGDGETGLNLKIQELGYKFAYIGTSITHHMIPPSRMTQRYLNKRFANQGNCDSYTAYRKYRYSNGQLMKLILMHVCKIVRCMTVGSDHVFTRKPSYRNNLAMVFYFANRIRYDIRLLHDHNFRSLVLKHDWLND